MIPGSATPLLLAQSGDDGYKIDRSLRFNSADSAYLNRTPSSAGNRKTWTLSFWVKLCGDSGHLISAGNDAFQLEIRADGQYLIANSGCFSNTYSTAVFRDYSAWQHFLIEHDASNTYCKIYINGSLQKTITASNADGAFNNNTAHNFSGRSTSLDGFTDFYLADVHFIDGQALDPTDFGEYDDNNVWQAKEVSITSPNDGTTWSSGWDGNAVNPTYSFDNTTNFTSPPNGTTTWTAPSSISVNSTLRLYLQPGIANYNTLVVNGTSYSQAQINAVLGTNEGYFTISGATSLSSITLTGDSGNNVVKLRYVEVDGYVLIDGANEYGTNGFHLDFSDNSSNAALGYDAAVDAPTLNPKGGMDVVTYTGNGSTQTISGLAFQPDLVWIKMRSTTGYSHKLVDQVRGATKSLVSNNSNAELTETSGLTAFTSDGFSLGSQDPYNRNNDTFVAWCWKAGGTAVSNTDGSITSQVSASTDYGFSIVEYTGTSASSNTIGHNLGSEAKFIIVKSTSDADNWFCYHIGLDSTSPENYDISLNTTGARRDFVSWNDTKPTSTVFSVGNTGATNENGRDYIAYCWSEVSGFSKFGSYTGNGSATGPTVTTGFKPRFLLIKYSSTGGTDWLIYDSARDSNTIGATLYPNGSYAENDVPAVDFLNDGFQIKATTTRINTSGGTYIYAAFADRPGNNWDVNNLEAEAAGLSTANQGFDVVTYSGNGSTQSISSLNFQPDLVWIKNRGSVSSHFLHDVVRGFSNGNALELRSDGTNAEGVPSTASTGLTSFNSDGFSLGSDGGTNANSNTFVAWCWKAGGTAVSNTDGTITSSVSVNTTYGFSICTYTGDGSGTANSDSGDSFGHGLSSAPKFILCKRRNSANGWPVYHASTALGALSLNGTNALDTGSYLFAQQHPSSSVVYLGNNPEINATGSTYVAYCWSEISGFSKFGSYSGTGATGHKITTGFKPAWILFKRTDSVSNWRIVDRLRGTASLNAETNEAEQTLNFAINDDGFTINETGNNPNASGGSYIYAAFAAKPDESVIDSLIDTPTNYEAASGNNGGNYATLNPLHTTGINAGTGAAVLSNGNLDATSNTSAYKNNFGTIVFPAAGKYYFEVTVLSNNGTNNQTAGIAAIEGTTRKYLLDCFATSSTSKRSLVDSSATSLSGSFNVGDVIGVAVDCDAGTAVIKHNNIDIDSGYTLASGVTYAPFFSGYNCGTSAFNFGQRAWVYSAPSNHKSLCTTNLPDPTIADGSKYFDTIIASGTGASKTFTMPGGFGPGLVWAKQRNGATNNALFDVVRGATKRLVSNANQAEDTQANQLSAFTSDGFTYGSDLPNASGNAGVYWAWDAGSSNTSISAGGLNSSVYDQSQTWSGGTTSGSATLSGNGFDKMFNGQYGSAGQTQSSGNAILTFTSPISFNKDTGDTLELIYWETFYVYTSAGTVTLSGGNSANNSFRDVTSNLPSGSITITGIGVNVTRGMRINGKPLIDSGVSVANVPTIASTVRANSSAGFSIVSYTGNGTNGATIGHGLSGVENGMIIVKNRSSTVGPWWAVFHASLTTGKVLGLNSTQGEFDETYLTRGIIESVTSSTYSCTAGSAGNQTANGNGDTHIAYCFAPVEGYSAFGSYTGNGSSDGPFVYTGFRPAFVLTKASSAGGNWQIIDSTRSDFNLANDKLWPNQSYEENSATLGGAGADNIDILSNGFKLKTSNAGTNGSGVTYIYAAFAEHPFKTARAR